MHVRLIKTLLGLAAFLALLKALGDTLIRRHETLEAVSAEAPGKRLAVGNLQFHYVDAGAGQPVVLVHGLGASTFSFRHNIPALARRFRVIAVDLPGFGYSTRDVADHSMTAQAAYLKLFLDALALERVSLVGHSMGGLIVQRFAAAYPERVARLVVISSATDPVMRRGSWASRALVPFLPSLFALLASVAPLRKAWLSVAVYDRSYLTPAVLDGYASPGRVRGNVRGLQRWFVDRGKDLPFDPSAISTPALIVWGEADRVLRPSIAVRLQQQIPNARLLVVPHAGHWAPEEQPEAVNSALLEFLSEGQDWS